MVFFCVVALVAGVAGSEAWGRKKTRLNPKQIPGAIRERQQRLHQIRVRLREEKVRLYHVNLKEEDLSHQLFSTVNRLQSVGADLDHLYVSIKRIRIQLSFLQQSLDYTRKKLQGHQQAMSTRLRDIYENGDIHYFTAISDSESFADFLNRLDFLSLIVKEDFTLLSRIKTEKARLELQERQFRDKYTELCSLQNTLMDKEKLLVSLKEKREYLLTEVQNQRQSISQNVTELENLSAEEEQKLQELIRLQQAMNARSGHRFTATGVFQWPCGGYISSPFGWRVHPIYGRTIFHTGLDIAAEYGTPIAAADDGFVIMASWYGGYGNAIVLDHGNGLSSLYGHCSALYVRCGQQVSKGQTIGAVGSTGNSTGPHLHFEVRQNGTPIDPRGKL